MFKKLRDKWEKKVVAPLALLVLQLLLMPEELLGATSTSPLPNIKAPPTEDVPYGSTGEKWVGYGFFALRLIGLGVIILGISKIWKSGKKEGGAGEGWKQAGLGLIIAYVGWKGTASIDPFFKILP